MSCRRPSPAPGRTLARRAACGLLPLVLVLPSAQADPGYYVATVYGETGRRTVEVRYWTVSRAGRPTRDWPELALGWQVTDRWYTELLASWVGSTARATRLSSWNWRNDLLLTQGEWPVDLALHSQWVRQAQPGHADALEFGPMLQTDVGRTQWNLNLVFERQLGADRSPGAELKYQWQLRHRSWPGLQVGLQGFGELGRWDHWAPSQAQSHRLGPALFGGWPAAGPRLEWQAAWLRGSTYGRHGDMVSARVLLSY